MNKTRATMANESAQTFGQRAVGMRFNPSGDDRVNVLKGLFAEVIDIMDEFRTAQGNGEAARLASVAITEAQGAQMWSVKAVTWGA